MFKELTTILRKGDTLALTIALEAKADPPTFRVNILPKLFTLDGENGQDRKALNTPISITGTVDELDSPAFVETLNRFTTSTNGLRHTIEEVETAHKAAADAKKTPPKPAAKAPVKPAPAPAKPVPAPVKAAPKGDKPGENIMKRVPADFMTGRGMSAEEKPKPAGSASANWKKALQPKGPGTAPIPTPETPVAPTETKAAGPATEQAPDATKAPETETPASEPETPAEEPATEEAESTEATEAEAPASEPAEPAPAKPLTAEEKTESLL